MLCKQHVHGGRAARPPWAAAFPPTPGLAPALLPLVPALGKALSGQAVGEARVPAPAPALPALCACSIDYPPISSHRVNHSELRKQSRSGGQIIHAWF